MTNVNYLQALMIYRKDNVAKLCRETGKQESNFGAKVKGRKEFRQSDIALLIGRYNLTPEQVFTIFFPEFADGKLEAGLAE